MKMEGGREGGSMEEGAGREGGREGGRERGMEGSEGEREGGKEKRGEGEERGGEEGKRREGYVYTHMHTQKTKKYVMSTGKQVCLYFKTNKHFCHQETPGITIYMYIHIYSPM